MCFFITMQQILKLGKIFQQTKCHIVKEKQIHDRNYVFLLHSYEDLCSYFHKYLYIIILS
jgi:hypothetical protein